MAETMKIYFCDICNESVPLGDIEAGKAFFRSGRVVCSPCDKAMSVVVAEEGKTLAGAAGATAPDGNQAATLDPFLAGAGAPARQHTAAGGGFLATVMAAVAILLTAGIGVLLFERMDAGDRQAEQDLAALRGDLRQELREVRGQGSDTRLALFEDTSRMSADLTELRTRVGERGESSKSTNQALREDIARVGERLATVEGLLTDVERHEGELSDVASVLGEMGADIRLLAEKLLELEEARLTAAVEPIPTQPQRPSWWHLVEQLESQRPGDRWTAVTGLGETGDEAVADHLTKMLKDPDIFVRMATARILGSLRASVGVPPLIDALEDPEASVREASVVALRTITGENFKFDPSAISEADRARKIKAWRDWWRRKGEDLLGGTP